MTETGALFVLLVSIQVTLTINCCTPPLLPACDNSSDKSNSTKPSESSTSSDPCDSSDSSDPCDSSESSDPCDSSSDSSDESNNYNFFSYFYNYYESQSDEDEIKKPKKICCKGSYEEYAPNGSYCEQSCATYILRMGVAGSGGDPCAQVPCPDDRTPGCYCKKGFYRQGADGKCGSYSECLFVGK